MALRRAPRRVQIRRYGNPMQSEGELVAGVEFRAACETESDALVRLLDLLAEIAADAARERGRVNDAA